VFQGASFLAARTDDHLFDLHVFSSKGGGTIFLSMPRADAAAGERLPFAYQWVAGTQNQPNPLLVIVAAPSASVTDRDGLLARRPSPTTPEVIIIRVQDPALVPPIGADLQAANLLRPSDLNRPQGWTDKSREYWARHPEDLELTPPENYFQIDRVRDGVEIDHPFDVQTVVVRVPQVGPILRRHNFPVPYDEFVNDRGARFAYELLPDGSPEGGDGTPMLKIVKTKQVEVSVRRGPDPVRSRPRSWFLEPRLPPPPFWQVWDVDDPKQVPMQGAPIVPGRGWRKSRVAEEETREQMFGRGAFDIAIGMVPVVGDLIDIAEFVWARFTGTDRWGRLVSEADVSIMAVGAMLPFITSPMLRNGRQLFKAYGEHADEAAHIIELFVKEGKLSKAEAKLIREMDDLIRAGRRPLAEMWEQWAVIAKRVGGEPPALVNLLNADRSGFLHAEIQEAYQAYKQRVLREGGAVADPITWARRTSRGPKQLLEKVLGKDFARTAKRSVDIPVRLANVPLPVRYGTPSVLQADLEKLGAHPKKLWERLSTFLDEVRDARAASLMPVIGRGRFKILKGNVAEVLSLHIQWGILKRIAENEEGAVLVSGVRVRRIEGGKVRDTLFSDNIIALMSTKKLEMRSVIEVKAGREGDMNVTMQIFEWIEGRLDEGSQVVIPKGSKIMSADGTVREVNVELVYTWRPKDPKAPAVTNLAAADRHRITAKGLSTLGLDSEFQTAAKVTPHWLDQTSDEIAYLTATLAKQKGVGSPP
jgi:hypothetical protein